MDLQTRVKIEKSQWKIGFHDPVMFIGSCFASEIGSKFGEGKMQVMINPAGTVYNPVSVINTLDSIIEGTTIVQEDLYCHEGTWLSFSHYTDFSSVEPGKVVDRINESSRLAYEFLANARFLFITFGTARVYRFRDTGKIVSNCHKIPSSFFTQELLEPGAISSIWNNQLDNLNKKFPQLKVIFTISPVRHLKDGAHGNQVSKSALFMAIEDLLKNGSSPGYFPAYEIMMDELRDYRFYNDDMLHPSQLAVDYIWDKFTESYFDDSTLQAWKEAYAVTRAMNHRITSGDKGGIKRFADNMLTRIEKLESYIPADFTREKEYFRSLVK